MRLGEKVEGEGGNKGSSIGGKDQQEAGKEREKENRASQEKSYWLVTLLPVKVLIWPAAPWKVEFIRPVALAVRTCCWKSC